MEEIKADGGRFFMLSIYCLMSLSNSAMWNTFAPISDESVNFYGVSSSYVNWLAIVWSVIYGPGTLLGIYVFQKFALRNTLILCGVLTLIGATVRWVAVLLRGNLGSTWSYAITLFGQVLIGLGQPIVCNLATGIASTWFPVQERDRAATIAAIFNPLGNAVGSILPPLLVHTASSSDNGQEYGAVRGMDVLMIVQMAMAALALALALFFFQSVPKSAPSRSEANRSTARMALKENSAIQDDVEDRASRASRTSRTSRASRSGRLSIDATAVQLEAGSSSQIVAEMRALAHNREYILLLLSFSICLGLANALLTLVFQLVSPLGYSNTQAGVLSFILIFVGIFAAGFVGDLLERTRAYRTMYTSLFALCLLSVGFYCAMLYPANFAGLCCAFGLIGVTIIPLFPVCLENTAECTYPISEDISVGILLTFGNVGTIVVTVAMDAVIRVSKFDNMPWNAANGFTMGVMGLGAVLALVYKGDTRRLRAEEAEEGDGRTSENPIVDTLFEEGSQITESTA